MRRAREDAYDLLGGVVRQIGVEAMQRGSETALQHDLRRIAALASVVDLSATLGRSTDRPEIDGGDILNKLLGG